MSILEKRLVVLGSTGSIGSQTLDVVDQLRMLGYAFRIVGLSAGRDSDAFRAQIDRTKPRMIAVAARQDADRLQIDYPDTNVCWGPDGLIRLAQSADVDLVVNALVGSIGLEPTLAALKENKAVALANKESLAIGGCLIQALLRDGSGSLLSIDSEHHALYRCLGDRPIEEVARLILTASGGPFLRTDASDLAHVSPEQALAHPTWSMGKRITIDCATMVNKAFEVIGAHQLFGVDFARIDVLIHPDSWVHSLVEFVDGSLLAELGPRDMRIAIQGILCHPKRMPTGLTRLPLEKGLRIEFEPFPHARYPAFATVLQAAKLGGSALAAMNAADEVLITRFLQREIPFPSIATGLHRILESWSHEIAPLEGTIDLQTLFRVDAWARTQSQKVRI
ncbi:MAG: 1-deoxy-D-xylulose-5-phosphate reductoisomerase [Candidatus Atribacteria bacterium]|nr:MAG: 1-deoxy-D-xylulose-5-phosphate reductoisomerase [Candidatus Atribacteria bacterium]